MYRVFYSRHSWGHLRDPFLVPPTGRQAGSAGLSCDVGARSSHLSRVTCGAESRLRIAQFGSAEGVGVCAGH